MKKTKREQNGLSLNKKGFSQQGFAKSGAEVLRLGILQGSAIVILLNICAKNPRLRQAQKRCRQGYETQTDTYVN